MKKFKAYFEAGESRNAFKNSHGVDYMVVKGEYNEEDFELYAEIDIDSHPDFGKFLEESEVNGNERDDCGKDITDFMNEKFDPWAYPKLKVEILRQAQEQGIPQNLIEFD